LNARALLRAVNFFSLHRWSSILNNWLCINKIEKYIRALQRESKSETYKIIFIDPLEHVAKTMQLQRTLAASSTSRYKIIHSNIDNTKPLLIYQIQPTSMWG
jgi:SpoVK/Ycf46/Vps4 family AAA+-type ATPase